MSDELTAPSVVEPAHRASEPVVRAAICVAVFAVVGALGGVLWRHLWSPVTGVVQQRLWFPTPFDAGEQHDFNGDAWYFIIALLSGIVLGAVAVLVMRGSEVLTLVAVAVGSAVAGLVMWRIGMLGNPADPVRLAQHAADGTRLPSRLYLANAVPLTAYPLGALGVLMSLFLTTGHASQEPVEDPGLESTLRG